MSQMDMYGFYTGRIFNAYQYLGAHIDITGTVFRVFAPNAEKVSIIGDFNKWCETEMEKIYDGNFYECHIREAKEGMRYKIRVHEKRGRFIDHCDPYGYGMELRPQNSSIIRNLDNYVFHDSKWMKKRTDGKKEPVNIYEVHLGSWHTNPEDENGWYSYSKAADMLIPYLLENHYNYVEIMPLCEYPCDASWGYQALGFYSPTSRYGDMDSLKQFVDKCHQNNIGVILDFAPVHFAVDDFGLAEFDGTPLYEYPHRDIAYNEWGSKNFAHSRGEVQSFLQSSVMYWIKEYHFDGIRMDAISNMIYWQGNADRGVNQGAVNFIKRMNESIKKEYPDVMLIAEDSTAYPDVTKSVSEGGLGFDYKWDMGWMNDTLEYFRENTADRIRDYYKLTFSMHYFYSEQFIMPFSHDEVVHGKATILQKMNGSYEEKFPQARALYMYMYAHPGKKLNFMGNENGQFREWDESTEQDWELLKYPKHDSFHQFMKTLNEIYMKNPALYEKDYAKDGFEWIACKNEGNAAYAFLRKGTNQTILAVFNFSGEVIAGYKLKLLNAGRITLLLDSNWECFGGTQPMDMVSVSVEKDMISMCLEPFSAKYYVVEDGIKKRYVEDTEMNEEWIHDTMIYHIYTLGFADAPKWNEGEKTEGSRILKVLEWIPHLKDLGINAVYFGPIFESLSHGYDTSDYYKTDRRLGTQSDFKQVFSKLHENGIRIILDGVFNHVGRGFWAFNDVQHNLEKSQYKDWFVNLDFTQTSPAGDKFSYETWEGNADLIKLNLNNQDVCNHLLGAVRMWIDEFDIDGLRLDAADCIDKGFFVKLHDFTKKYRKNFWLMGEIIHGDYTEWANPQMLDSVTNYECWKGIYSSHNDKNYFEIAYSLKRQFGKEGLYRNLILYNFLDNHDVSRIQNLLTVKENIQNAYTILYMMPGVPSIYYGSEWGIEGKKESGADADLKIRPALNLSKLEGTNQELISHIKNLAQIRKTTKAVRYGTYHEILVKNEQFVFARELESQYLIVCLNLSDTASKVFFDYKGKKYEVLIKANSSVILQNNELPK